MNKVCSMLLRQSRVTLFPIRPFSNYSKPYNGGGGYKSGYQSVNFQKKSEGGDYQKKEDGSSSSTTGGNLMYNNKRIYLRGYNITKDKVMLAIQPKPAQFQET